MHATPPPAIHALAKVCADDKPQNINVMTSAVLHSPDCKWVVVLKGEDGPTPDFRLGSRPEADTAYLADAKTGHIIAHFEMARSASLHWLKGNRYLIVNYFEGSGSARPLVFDLKPGQSHKAADLSDRVLPDVLRRIHKHRQQVYHYYVYYLQDNGNSVTISAMPEYTLRGTEGPGDGKCLIYSVEKASLRYRFIENHLETDAHPCPTNPDEKWD